MVTQNDFHEIQMQAQKAYYEGKTVSIDPKQLLTLLEIYHEAELMDGLEDLPKLKRANADLINEVDYLRNVIEEDEETIKDLNADVEELKSHLASVGILA